MSQDDCAAHLLRVHPHQDTCRRYGLVSLLCIWSLMAFAGCNRVPQVLSDEAVFGELDALYTAVTTKRPDLLKECQRRIANLHDEKRMSDAGYKEVQAIVTLSEQNKWSSAAQRLYDFMRGQRKVK